MKKRSPRNVNSTEVLVQIQEQLAALDQKLEAFINKSMTHPGASPEVSFPCAGLFETFKQPHLAPVNSFILFALSLNIRLNDFLIRILSHTIYIKSARPHMPTP